MKWNKLNFNSAQISKSLALFWLLLLVAGSLLVRCEKLSTFEEMDVNHIYEFPSRQFLMGTDSLGRSYFFRVLKGSGISLMIALQSSFLCLIIAMVFGGIAGWFSKRLDFGFTIILDVWMSLPTTVLASLVALVFLENNESLMLVSVMIGVTHWGRLARLIRSEIIRIKEMEFVSAAQLFGGNSIHIVKAHIFPHLRVMIGITLLYQLPTLILSESFMSFIGLGIHPPETSWGLLLQEGWRNLRVYPHVVLFPALFLFLTILSLNQLSENLDNFSSDN